MALRINNAIQKWIFAIRKENISTLDLRVRKGGVLTHIADGNERDIHIFKVLFIDIMNLTPLSNKCFSSLNPNTQLIPSLLENLLHKILLLSKKFITLLMIFLS